VKIENNAMVRKENPVEVWERQGLILDVECWLQMVDNILIERILFRGRRLRDPPMNFKAKAVM
jgi:hypothetical protein